MSENSATAVMERDGAQQMGNGEWGMGNARARRSISAILMIPWACAIGLLIALAWPFFVGRVYVADDLGEMHLPLRMFYARQLAAGEAFDWNPDLFGGFYLTG